MFFCKRLERIEAYKKFVDQEKEAALTQAKRELTEEKNKSAESLLSQLNHLSEQFTNLAELIARLLPFVQPADRAKLLDARSTDLIARLNDRFLRLAEEAPDLSRPEARRGLEYAAHFIRWSSGGK
jgi:thioredoxin-like negative regulator of GroEL